MDTEVETKVDTKVKDPKKIAAGKAGAAAKKLKNELRKSKQTLMTEEPSEKEPSQNKFNYPKGFLFALAAAAGVLGFAWYMTPKKQPKTKTNDNNLKIFDPHVM